MSSESVAAKYGPTQYTQCEVHTPLTSAEPRLVAGFIEHPETPVPISEASATYIPTRMGAKAPQGQRNEGTLLSYAPLRRLGCVPQTA